MGPLGTRPRLIGVTGLVAGLLAWHPAIVWAHETGSPDWTVPGPISLQTFSVLAVAIWIWCAVRLCPASYRTRLRRALGRAVPWALATILSLYLVALPPHLVHHLGDSQDEALGCILFVQGITTDQDDPGPVILVPGPAFACEVTGPSTPSVLPSLTVPASGRSPPRLYI